MSIKTSSSWLQSLCSFNFLKAKDLRKSSLNKTIRPAKIQTQYPNTDSCRLSEERIPSRKASVHGPKRDFDTPVKNEKRTSITEKDFRIMQVFTIVKEHPD